MTAKKTLQKSVCDDCKKVFQHNLFDNQPYNYGFSLCSLCKRKAKRLTLRISAANYKNNQCEICGLKRKSIDDLEIFDFHHINKDDKLFELGDKIADKSWENIKAELDKCMMLCANCHRKQHFYKRNETVIRCALHFIDKYV